MGKSNSGAGGFSGAMAVILGVVVIGFVGGIILPLFTPLVRTGLTSMKDGVATASVNTTLNTAITLVDYGVMGWGLGIGMSLLAVGISLIFIAIKKIKG